VPNAETWLDFTDLVFVDPPGTGYSRLVGGDEVRRSFWSVDGDAEALAVFIRKWIDQTGRQNAPKFLVGESYGGMRVLKIERALEQHQGIGVRGLVLVSPVLDFANLSQRRHAPLSYVFHLPSMAATVRELNGSFDRAGLAAVEQYASGEYLADLMRGERDQAAVKRISTRVAALTGLDPALVERLGGRIDSATFQRELYRARGLVGSAYDATITAFDPSPTASQSQFPDPVLDATRAPLVSAMTGLYRETLNWRVDQPYRLLNDEVSSRWNWGRGRGAVQAVDDLRTILASDWRTHVLIAHGASDLVTPYYANKLILDQLPAYGSPERAKLAVYGGGHMFYSRDASRRELRSDAEALYRAALTPERPAGE
jgi:carboxypeptidase C (cathepsin A)